MKKLGVHMPERFIVKCQLSLATSNAQQRALIHDKKRKVLLEQEVSSEIKAAFRPKEYKMFQWARIANGNLVLEGRAPWQDW